MITVFIWAQSFTGAFIKALVWAFQTLCVDRLFFVILGRDTENVSLKLKLNSTHQFVY